MFEKDTIAAIATPLGTGGIGIIRISGGKSLEIAKKLFRSKVRNFEFKPYKLHYGEVVDTQDSSVIDEVLLSYMGKQASYTKEDVVEINCHSGFLVLKRILEAVLREGARLAEPGEFTKRAFVNGRIDLSQAEAVIDIVTSQTEASLKIATQQLEGSLSKEISHLKDSIVDLLAPIEASIDFPEEDLDVISSHEIRKKISGLTHGVNTLIESYEEGRLYREGISTIIIGKPNVGKSSLLNALLREKRAIVTPVPGTTRDLIEEGISIKGFPLKITDTAGIGETQDLIEEEGIKLAKEKLASADLVIFVLDSSQDLDQADYNIFAEITDKKVIVALNKIDLAPDAALNEFKTTVKDYTVAPISALYSQGIEELRESIYSMIVHRKVDHSPSVLITNTRHRMALEKVLGNLLLAGESIINKMSPEFTALDLRLALRHLGEIIGDTTSEDILDTIFSSFCIGK